MELREVGPEEMHRFGVLLGQQLQTGDLITLSGGLGAGKTTLTRGIGEGLGVREAVTSPTFALIQEYQGRIALIHADPYRLESVQEAIAIGFEEYLERDAAMVIEWPERVLELLPDDLLSIEISMGEQENTRKVSISTGGKRSERLLSVLF